MTDAAAYDRPLTELLTRTVTTLEAGKARDEALGAWKPTRKFIPSQPTLVPVGRAWRLGSLLLSRDARLFRTGSVTRAIQPKEFLADKSLAAEARRDEQRAAARGPFFTGDIVNFDFEELHLGDPDRALHLDADGHIIYRERVDELRLDRYLADRAQLLVDAT